MPDDNQNPQTFPEDTIIPPIPSGMAQDTSFPNPIQTITDAPPQEVNVPPGLPPIIPSSKPKKKFGGRKMIATILGLLVLVGAVAAGVVLVKQQQDIREKAAGDCSDAGGSCKDRCIAESETADRRSECGKAKWCCIPIPPPPINDCSDAGGSCKDRCSADSEVASRKSQCGTTNWCCVPKPPASTDCSDAGGSCKDRCSADSEVASRKSQCGTINWCCVPKSTDCSSASGSCKDRCSADSEVASRKSQCGTINWCCVPKTPTACTGTDSCIPDHENTLCEQVNGQWQRCTHYVGDKGYKCDLCNGVRAGDTKGQCAAANHYCIPGGFCITNTTCEYRATSCTPDPSCATATPTPTPMPGYVGCGEACNDYIHCIPSLNCPGGPGGGHCVNGRCPQDPDCVCNATPTPTPTPKPRTPTPTPRETPVCQNIKAYDTNWGPIVVAQLSTLKPGDKIRFTVSGTPANKIDKARFIINGITRPETTNKAPWPDVFYDEYTIPAGVTSFTVNAQLHHVTLGWF